MTLIAGIFNRKGLALPDSACASLRQAISRNPADEVEIFSDQRSYFAKVDIGAFREPGSFRDSKGALSLLAGEPLLGKRGITSNRLHDLTAIHEQVPNDDWNGLRDANGTFALVHYQPHLGALYLVADKVGLRPLYYWLNEEWVVFASALRILEALEFVPKRMDLRAVTEIVALGTPLADRTPYADVFLIKPAEVIQITEDRISRGCYWRWDEIKEARESEKIRLVTVFDRFQAATKRRNGNDEATAAYLSGGLDSRCVVAALCEHGTRVRTVNFARPGTQDYYFGNDFGEKIGSIHRSIPKEKGDSIPDYSAMMARALAEFDGSHDPTDRPRLVWSGEGGSVLLGHIHLSEAIVQMMRAGNVDRAIDEFVQMEQIDLPVRLLRPQILAGVRDVIKQGLQEELEPLHAEDAGRNFYIFLMQNDQRRKLSSHFENIDQHRLEFQLPFFDGEFIASVMATPLDWCLRHNFYNKWLSLFPEAVTSVPWQSYPGHETCPLPIPADLTYQWNEDHQAREQAARRKAVVARALHLLRGVNFPDRILDKRKLRLAAWIHATGWRNYQYAIEAAETYSRYSSMCKGEFTTSLS